jgi:tetratricopeptide (TPR) repeat protein
VRKRPFAPWIWPALLLLWANVHAGFAFGLGAIGLDVLTRTVQASLGPGRLVLPRRAWLGLGLCFAALLVNPWGFGLLSYPLAYLDASSPFRSIAEWLPPDFDLDPRSYAGRFWWLAAAAAPGIPLTLRHRDPYPALLALVAFAMAVSARRFIPLFAVCATPLLAGALGAAVGQLAERWAWSRRPDVALACTATALVAALALLSGVRLLPSPLDRWVAADIYPRAAVRYLTTLGAPQRIFNYYNWGGYLMLNLPDSRVFIDGRANTVYSDAVLDDYRAIVAAEPGFRARLSRHRPDAANWPIAAPLSGALASGPNPWTLVYRDSVAEVLLPPDSPLLHQPLPSAERAVGDDAQLQIGLSESAVQRGRLDEALAIARQAVEANPLAVIGYGQLARLHSERRDVDGVQQAIARGLRAQPRRWRELRELEGRAYERAGYLPRALDAYRRSLPSGPFQPDAVRRALIERVEERMRSESPAQRGGQ